MQFRGIKVGTIYLSAREKAVEHWHGLPCMGDRMEINDYLLHSSFTQKPPGSHLDQVYRKC